ncbi:MAG TPA: hypothetical protein VFK03_04425, partial [Candidatus Saccharimonadales bacterium]|nr:hypothetical protein [Candidatus Saccharimonadales bacterium]
VTGSTGSTGAGDVFLAKYDGSGNLDWSKTLGSYSHVDIGYDLVQTNDGGYAITGEYNAGKTCLSTCSYTSSVFIGKYDSQGDTVWFNAWDLGLSNNPINNEGHSLVQTADGGYAVTGSTDSYGAGGNDMFLAQYDTAGNLSWTRTWGDTGNDEGKSLVQTSDGGYAVAGVTASYGAGGNDMLLAKFNDSGSIVGCDTICSSPVVAGSVSTDAASNFTASTLSLSYTGTSVTLSTSSFTPSTTEIIALNPPATAVDVGAPLAAQDTAATAPVEDTIFRLRLDLHVSGAQDDAGGANLRLQYALKGEAASCSAVSSNSYNFVTDTSEGIRWGDNTGVASNMSLTTNANDPKHGSDTTVPQTYLEKGTTTFNNPTAIPVGQDGMWDFALVAHHSYQNTTYCFRVSQPNGANIAGYDVYPELNIPAATISQAGYRLFENQDVTAAPGSWSEATSAANWGGRYGYGTLNYDGKMWVMGGYDGSFLGDVWSSTDGSNWTQVTASAPWGGNVDAGVVVFDNKMWLMGGYAPAAAGDTSDVWYSTDGANWTKATTAPWSIREHCVTLVFDNKLWVIGGSSNGTYLHDAWYTSDGVNWTQATANAPWSARYRPSGVTFNGKMYIMGGTTNNTSNFLNDVWSSTDGINWTQETAAASWPGRAFFTSVVYAGKIWVTGGYDATLNYNDLWYSSDGVNWTQEADAPWIPRQGITALAYDDKMWILGGYSPTSGNLNDVWSFYVPANIDVGAPLASTDKPVELTGAEVGQPFRLRTLVAVDNFGVAPSDLDLKLQYARMQGNTCSATPSGSFSDVTSTSTVHFYDNTNANNAIKAVANVNDPTDGSRPIDYQVYSEINPFTNSESAIYSGEDGLWDFPLAVQAGTGHTSFCFRIINNDGSLLSDYGALPQIGLVPTMQQLMRGGEWFSRSDYGNRISL